MNRNLDELVNDIVTYLPKTGLQLFRGFSRADSGKSEVEWDTFRFPDFKQYIEIAHALEAKIIVLHQREFAAGLIDDAIDDVENGGGYDEDGAIVKRLNEMRMYEGFTCAVEMSFDYGGTTYFWETHAPWYDEYQDVRDELDLLVDAHLSGSDSEDEDEDDETLGGYYSKN